MDRPARIDWTIEGDVDKEYEITGLVSPGTKGKLTGPPEDSYPPEDPQVDDIKITLDGKLLAESDWEKHEFTKDVIQQVIESLIETAGVEAQEAEEAGE